jgi:PIN domain nuclease of toxin-antitoxin system
VHQALLKGEVFVSSVNVVEVLTKLIDRDATYEDAVTALEELQLICVDVTTNHALRAAALRVQTRSLGLSVGDRACLALGIALGHPVLTADRAWSTLELPVAIVQIR